MLADVDHEFATTATKSAITKKNFSNTSVIPEELEVVFARIAGGLEGFKLMPKGKWIIPLSVIIQILPYPLIKQDIYQFENDIQTDAV